MLSTLVAVAWDAGSGGEGEALPIVGADFEAVREAPNGGVGVKENGEDADAVEPPNPPKPPKVLGFPDSWCVAVEQYCQVKCE